MKKVLFTTTALVASAGIASAEVSLSGYAEIGVKGSDSIETQFHNDIDVKFSLSGATDNGLTFGATIDLDEINNSAEVGGLGTLNRSSVFVSGDWGTLTMGDTDGAFDRVMQEVGSGTSIADDHTTHAGFNGNSGLDGAYDGQILRYDYSFGDFSIAASLELDDTGAGDPTYGIGGKFSTDMGGVMLGFGLGYQANDVDDIWGISASADMGNGFGAVVNYSDRSGATDITHTGLGISFETGPHLVGFNWGQFDTAGVTTDGYGLVYNYDLGGGAVAMAGYGDGDTGSSWSLGLGLSF